MLLDTGLNCYSIVTIKMSVVKRTDNHPTVQECLEDINVGWPKFRMFSIVWEDNRRNLVVGGTFGEEESQRMAQLFRLASWLAKPGVHCRAVFACA